jgi:hypothetical protein
MEESKGNPEKKSHFKLPNLRSYIQVADLDSLRNTLAFLSRKIKSNDLYVKTLLTGYIEKQEDHQYYAQFVENCLKYILVAKKKKLTPKRLIKLSDWLEAAEELLLILSQKNNLRELWLFCWNLQDQCWTWLNYDDFHHPILKDFMVKITETIAWCYKSTPAMPLKNEILQKESDLLIHQKFPLTHEITNPYIFLLDNNSSMGLRNALTAWLRQHKNQRYLRSEERVILDKVHFQTLWKEGKSMEALTMMLQGYNSYENIKYTSGFCIENKDLQLAIYLTSLLVSSSLHPDFIDEQIEQLNRFNLLKSKDLAFAKLKIFLLHGRPQALEKAKQLGYEFEEILAHMRTLLIEETDLRYAYLCLSYQQLELFKKLLLQSDFFSVVTENLDDLEPKEDALQMINESAIGYLRNTLGPSTHHTMFQLCRYLKYNRHNAHLKNLKVLLKKEFPERSMLLDAIKNL